MAIKTLAIPLVFTMAHCNDDDNRPHHCVCVCVCVCICTYIYIPLQENETAGFF